MQVHTTIENFPDSVYTVATLGTFDGVHLGHRKLLEQVRQSALEHGGQSVVITFDPPPRLFLQANSLDLRFLSTPKEKICLIESCDIDHLLMLPFDEAMASIDPETFVRSIFVDALKINAIILGYDHHFGKHGQGNIFTLKALAPTYGFAVEKLDAADFEGAVVSSTRIREAIAGGEIETANALLGRPYALRGLVVEGRKLGRTIGFPTANVQVNYPWKMIPANGVYAVQVRLGNEEFTGMCNIGFRPTVGGLGQTIEVFIFGFDRDIYGRKLAISFQKKTREEKKFPGLDALKEALYEDERIIRHYFSVLSV